MIRTPSRRDCLAPGSLGYDRAMPSATEPIPSQSLSSARAAEIAMPASWPDSVTPEWAWGDSGGEGMSVCILDSGVEGGHPAVGEVERAVAAVVDGEGLVEIVEDSEGDVFGHGTACAGIVRSLAPECAIASVRVLGEDNRGSGAVMLTGLHWAIEQGYRVINMSLSTTKRELLALLHEFTDQAYFQGTTIVASAHNMAVSSYPWRFSSVISVGSHDEDEPRLIYANPEPPVEFFARGMDLEVAWRGGGKLRSSGNSFATAHVSGLCAQILAKHPELTPFEVKSVLRAAAPNVGAAAGAGR